MGKTSGRPRLSVAGPGAGKTHTMVDEIARALATLPQQQHLVAITFTNAAANTIRERLNRRTRVRGNVFIGTTHTFVSRFVLSPCATLFGKLPEERLYAAIDVHAKGKGATNYTRNLIKKGIVPFDAMVPIARELLKLDTVRARLSRRIAHLFVDEFQDTDIGMLEIIDQFRKSGQTRLYAVGDPEQFVMGFTYRGTTIPAFDKLPFFRFEKQADSRPLIENHRSNPEIVEFANRFRDDLQQKSMKPKRDTSRVLFIRGTVLREIVTKFQEISADVEVHGAVRTRLYLSEVNATFDSIMEEFGIRVTSNLGKKTPTLLGDALELIATALDRTPRKVCLEMKLSRIQWRSAGTSLLKQVMRREFCVQDFVGFIAERFGHAVSSSRVGTLQDGLDQLKSHLATGLVESCPEQTASIRRAKGLEADAVLALALGLAELKKWLSTDRSSRIADKQDKCRLGYVAFTRPREMLCIACLKPLDADSESLIRQLGVKVV